MTEAQLLIVMTLEHLEAIIADSLYDLDALVEAYRHWALERGPLTPASCDDHLRRLETHMVASAASADVRWVAVAERARLLTELWGEVPALEIAPR